VHDDVVTLLDHHLRELEAVRRRLCASRQVRFGERGAALAESLAASRHYAEIAAGLLTQIQDVAAPVPAAPAVVSRAAVEVAERAEEVAPC
jgi:hypothetical protein